MKNQILQMIILIATFAPQLSAATTLTVNSAVMTSTAESVTFSGAFAPSATLEISGWSGTHTFACVSGGSWSLGSGETFTCAKSGTWSFKTASYTAADVYQDWLTQIVGGQTDGRLTLTFVKMDGTTLPAVTANEYIITSSASAVTFSGTCASGTTLTLTGTGLSAKPACTSGKWTYTTPSVSTDIETSYNLASSKGMSIILSFYKIAAATTAKLVASPASIDSGGSSTLTYSSTNATSCTGTNFTASGTSGSVSVKPTADKTYSISCTGAGGTSSASAPITVITGAASYIGNSMQGISLVTFDNYDGGNWIKFSGTDTKYGDTLPRFPASPWGGTPATTDAIQQIWNVQGDITEAIVTDNSVPSSVSNKVLLTTLVNPYTSSKVTQDCWIIHPDTSVAQGMVYTSRWLWFQGDLTSRANNGALGFEIAEFKTPDETSGLGTERFQISVEMAGWTGYGATTPVFELTHNWYDGNGVKGVGTFNYSFQTLLNPSGNSYGNGIAQSGYGQTHAVPVPVGRWYRLEWAFNRSDSQGQGWMWLAITDPGSSDPALKAGVQVFAARGPYTFDDSTSGTFTFGLNELVNKTMNRIFLHDVSYGPMVRSPSNPYVFKMTDMLMYTSWPSTATAHPANYQ